MSKTTKKLNIELFRRRYFRSNRKGKTKLLDELCDLYGFNRKYLLQVFNGLTRKQHIKRGAKCRYFAKDLLEPLTQIWLATDQMCSRKLTAAIELWLPHYELVNLNIKQLFPKWKQFERKGLVRLKGILNTIIWILCCLSGIASILKRLLIFANGQPEL